MWFRANYTMLYLRQKYKLHVKINIAIEISLFLKTHIFK
jgi:hypothetical protein